VTGPKERHGEAGRDLQRFETALLALVPAIAALTTLEGGAVTAYRTASFVAIGLSRQDERAEQRVEFANWVGTLAGPPHEYLIWPNDPFADTIPEMVAVAEALVQFKRHAQAVRPDGNRFAVLPDTEISRLRGRRASLTDRVTRHLADWRGAWHEQAHELGLDHVVELAPPHGQPRAHVWLDPERPFVTTEWGFTQSEVVFENGEAPPFAEPLAHFLGPAPKVQAYSDLIRRLEDELGSSIESQAWYRPTLLGTWPS